MGLLPKEEMDRILRQTYLEKYGQSETDIWHPSPARNVRVFSREGRIITLMCHILTGEVGEFVE